MEAADGVEALEICQEPGNRIDLLLTDIIMPRMRGTELAARVAQIRPDIAVVFVSGYSEEALARNHAIERIRILEKPHTSKCFSQLSGKL